jgi:hypothetical protein
MTARDRTVLMVLGIVVLVAAFFLTALKPKRDEAKALDAKVTAAQQRVTTATSAIAEAQAAKQTFRADYAAVARLGKAVPTDDDTPALVYQLERAADRARVDFRTIELASGGASAAPAAATTGAQVASVAKEEGKTPKGEAAPAATPAVAATQTAAAGLPPGAAVGPAGFPTMPFDFKFTGRFFRLETFLEQLDRMVRIDKGGGLSVHGRLLTIDGFSLSEGPTGFPSMSASIRATSYLLPESEGLTDGATASSPAAVSDTTTTSGGSAPTPVAAAGVGG